MDRGPGKVEPERGQEGLLLSRAPLFPALSLGLKRSMTDHQGQGGTQLDHSLSWGSPINCGLQHGWCLMSQDYCGHRYFLFLLALVSPQEASGGRRGWERKAALALGSHRLYQENSQPGVEAARSRGRLTHTS